MIQRFLFDTLKSGLAAIQAQPDLLNDIFDQYGLSATEIDTIRKLWKTKPPLVKHQYARTDDDFPLYSIVLGGEQETGMYIGNEAGQILDEDDVNFGADIKSSIWSMDYQVLCYSEHPDHTSYLYEVAKAIFVSADLVACGLHNSRFSGMDLRNDLAYIPAHLFARVFAIKVEREFERIDRDSRLTKAFKVAGIHIDKSGSPSDVGGVKTQVKPFAEGGDV